jgi:hypothetical protein
MAALLLRDLIASSIFCSILTKLEEIIDDLIATTRPPSSACASAHRAGLGAVQLCSFLLPTCLRKSGVHPWCSNLGIQ